MKKIISLAGNARTGKDTVAAALISILAARGVTAKRLAFGDPVKKEIANFIHSSLDMDVFTENPTEKPIVREVVRFWGEFRKKHFNSAYWVDQIAAEISDGDDDTVFIVTDVRFFPEYEMMHDMGAFSVFLERRDSHGDIIPPGSNDEKALNPELKRIIGNTIILPNFTGPSAGIPVATEKFLTGLRHRWDPTQQFANHE